MAYWCRTGVAPIQHCCIGFLVLLRQRLDPFKNKSKKKFKIAELVQRLDRFNIFLVGGWTCSAIFPAKFSEIIFTRSKGSGRGSRRKPARCGL